MPQDGDIDISTDSDETPAAAAPAQKRGPGHRAADARDTAAEMAARAHEISLEAGSRMSGAMREVIGAAAGLSEFAIESARDLIHYMVRRGQMTQDEGDSLVYDAEQAYIAKHGALPKPEPKAPPPKPIPLGQLPKAVAAPAAAAEAALEARAALRAQDPRPAGPPLVEVAPKPLGKATPVRDVRVDPAEPSRTAKPAANAKQPAAAAKTAAKSAPKSASTAADKGKTSQATAKPAAPAKTKAAPAPKSSTKAATKAAPAKSAKSAVAAKAPPAKSPAKAAPKTAAKPAAGKSAAKQPAAKKAATKKR